MAATENKKSFWEIFAIVVGAIAALITAIAALLAALNGGAAKEKDVPPATEAERLRVEARAKTDELERKLAEAEQKKAAAASSVPKQGDITVDGFTGMRLAYVPGGCFMMGSSANDKDHEDDEGPVHEVCVDSFWMGQYEVTQGQCEKVMGSGSNPSNFKKGGNYPVEQVSWNDAQDFIKKLNSRTSKKYRLPTEAEWEHACRANGSSKYCGGDDPDAVAWHDGNSGKSTHAVGGKKANAFGLHDMSGNVWEWCADWYDSGYYASSPRRNPAGPDSGGNWNRVLRGGSFFNAPLSCRAVNRGYDTLGDRLVSIGFRLVLPVR